MKQLLCQECGFDWSCHQLNVLGSSSITQFYEWLKENYGGIDILENYVDVDWRSNALREQLSDMENITEELIDGVMTTFLRQVEDGSWKSGGRPIPFTDYFVSKLVVNSYPWFMVGKLFDRAEGKKKLSRVIVFGFVKTNLTC